MQARDDLALLTAAARESADIALSFFGNSPRVWHKDDDAGPVTEADYAVDIHLRESLTGARPDYGWLSEETPDTPARQACRRVFIIDPIDGTRAFIDGTRNWGHSLAIAEDGFVTAAVVYMPRRDKLYTAVAGQGAHLNGAPLVAATRSDPDGATMLGNRNALSDKYWAGDPPPATIVQRYPMAYRLACLAEGRFDALFSPRPIWEWDLAGGALLLQESGHTLTDPSGQPIAFNSPTGRSPGALAANPTLHAALMTYR